MAEQYGKRVSDKVGEAPEECCAFPKLLGATERFAQYRAIEATWGNKRLSLQRKHTAVTQEISEIAASITYGEEEEKKCAPIQQALTALLAGKVTWGRSEISGALQDAFHYLFADTANRLRFISQMDDGLQILKQVGLTPPAEGHLLMYAMWLKEAAHTHNTAWAESRQLIDQAEEEIARLNEMSQLQKVIARSILDKKRQAPELATQIDALQNTLQYLTSEMDRLRIATAALNILPQIGAGSIASILQAFLRSELPQPLAGSRQLTPLKIETVFPQEIVTIIQRDTPAAFLGTWHSAERAIQDNIQKTASERENYNQICSRLAHCEQSFDRELSFFPGINRELGRMRPEGYIPIPQDTASFSQLVSRIENNLKNIDEMRTTSPSIMARFFREQEKQALKLFRETRALLIAAERSRESIPRQVRESNAKLFANLANIAAEFTLSLQQWLGEQQVKARNDHGAALVKADRLGAENSIFNAAVSRKKLNWLRRGEHLIPLCNA